MEIIPQGLHGRGDHPQILGNEGQILKRLPPLAQHGGAWRLAPTPTPGVLILAGNRPVGLQGTEVVDAQHVGQAQLAADAFPPPAETLLLMAAPDEGGGTPQLTRGGKVIRRDTALLSQRPVPIHTEEMGVAPHVAAVVGHVKGHVPNDGDAPASGLAQQVSPLAVQLPLEERLLVNGVGSRAADTGQGVGVVLRQGTGPPPPRSPPLKALDHQVEAVVLQPGPLIPAPCGEVLHLWPTDEPLPIALQQRPPQVSGAGIGQSGVQAGSRRLMGARQLTERVLGNEAGGVERLPIQKPGADGRGAGGVVGGTQGVGVRQGQHLPCPQAMVGQGGDPGRGFLAEAATARRPAQACGMQQNTRTAPVETCFQGWDLRQRFQRSWSPRSCP